MFTHVMLGSGDIERSKKFYDAVFTELGAAPGNVDPAGRLFYSHNGSNFALTKPINGQPASCGNGATVGFAAQSEEQVKAWHDAGVANGGTSVEDPPGFRDFGPAKIYAAYLRDPDGNKICAIKMPG